MSTLPLAYESLCESLDPRARDILELRRETPLSQDRGWLMRRMLLVADIAGLGVAFIAAQLVVASTQPGRIQPLGESMVFLASLPLWVVMAKLYGLYDRDEQRADHSTADEAMAVFHLVTVGTWLLFVGSYLTRLVDPQLPKLFAFWALAVVAVPSARGASRIYCRRQINYVQNTVIVGAGDVGQEIARKLLKHPEYGLNLVGFVDAQPRERCRGLEHLTVLGGLDDLPPILRLLDIERVILAFSNDCHEDVLELLRDLSELNVQVDVVPRFFEVLGASVDIHTVEGIPLVGVRPPRLSRSSAFLKRGLDLAGALVGLVLLAPLLAVVAAAIKLDSHGPVCFRQVRMGGGTRSFRIVKFRTMVADAEARKPDLVHLNKHRRDGDARMFKIDDDPRITRVGRVLRRFSIDELPQLWNVLCGQMSLVGPRPLILGEHACVNDWAQRRLDLKPGMTGLWQVLGRDEIAFAEMVRLDYLYVTGWSVGEDVRLLLKTIPVVIGRRPSSASGRPGGRR